MPLPDWATQLISFFTPFLTGSTVTILGLVYIFITNPDKIQEWGNIIIKLLAYRSKKAERVYMSTDIKLTIDKERKKLGFHGDILSYGIEIKWTDEESAEIDLKDNKVILMMHNFKSQAKNLANAISLYVPRALLPNSRVYVYPYIMTGLDYVIGKNLLVNNSVALEYFQEREIIKHNDIVIKILDLMESINTTGRLSRIYVNELKSLGVLYPRQPSKEVYEETINLLKNINEFETAEPGDVLRARGIFQGDMFNVCIVPVGKAVTISTYGVQKHLDFIGDQIKRGLTHFYIISAGGSRDAKMLTELACLQYKLTTIYEDTYKGIFRGKKSNMYCSLCAVKEE